MMGGENSIPTSGEFCIPTDTRARTKAEAAVSGLMEAVVDRGNLWLAYQRVVANKGAPGVDACQ
jgi:hypothetical protein